MKYLVLNGNYVDEAENIQYDSEHKVWTVNDISYSDFDGTMYMVSDVKPPKDSQEIINERNRRLAETDWTQYPKSGVDKAAWENYRQELRDLTEQENFPYKFIWPNLPGNPIQDKF